MTARTASPASVARKAAAATLVLLLSGAGPHGAAHAGGQIADDGFGSSQAGVAAMAATQTVKLGLNKSVVVDLPADAYDILVANPAVADAVTRTARRIFLFGKAVGVFGLFVLGGLAAAWLLDRRDGLGGGRRRVDALLPVILRHE